MYFRTNLPSRQKGASCHVIDTDPTGEVWLTFFFLGEPEQLKNASYTDLTLTASSQNEDSLITQLIIKSITSAIKGIVRVLFWPWKE